MLYYVTYIDKPILMGGEEAALVVAIFDLLVLDTYACMEAVGTAGGSARGSSARMSLRSGSPGTLQPA